MLGGKKIGKQLNYKHLTEKISQLAQQCGRNPTEITLIAVSKGYSWDSVQPAYAEGCRHFGENRVQEALPKMAIAPEDIQWHMIGTLQKNKVHQCIGKFVMIHSVDSVELAKKISTCSVEANLITPILLQVNTSGEASKHGFSSDGFRHALPFIQSLPGIRVEGLMTMAPFTEEKTLIHNCFANLRKLRDHYGLKHLSMGMSHDYPIAIEEGATLLRIGSALFQT